MPKAASTFPVRGVPGGWRDAWSAPDDAGIARAQFAAWDAARGQREAAGPAGDGASPADRHVVVGIGQPTDDPTQHRAFTLRARFDAAAGGWTAQVGEQNCNDQRGAWRPIAGDASAPRGFPTAAACLGAAVTRLIAAVDQDAATTAPPS